MRMVARIAVVATGTAILAVAFATAAAQGSRSETAEPDMEALQPAQAAPGALRLPRLPIFAHGGAMPRSAADKPVGGHAEAASVAATQTWASGRRMRSLDNISACDRLASTAHRDGVPDGGRQAVLADACRQLHNLSMTQSIAVPGEPNVHRAARQRVVFSFDTIVVSIDFGG